MSVASREEQLRPALETDQIPDPLAVGLTTRKVILGHCSNDSSVEEPALHEYGPLLEAPNQL